MPNSDGTGAIPSSSQTISKVSSTDGSPIKEESLVEALKSQVDGGNIEDIVQSQKKSLERFEKTNEMLGTCCILAEKRLERARKEFAANREQIVQAKSELDSIFRRIGTFKQTLASKYPKEYAEELERLRRARTTTDGGNQK